MTDEELVSILRKEEQSAANWQDSELQSNRTEALDYYDRKPLGDEVEGQSRIVTSEVADTVESLMPGLMRVFASGEDVVEFTPDNRGDEQAAKEASDYVSHVIMRQNDGFRVLHWFFKDALMFRLSGLTVDEEEVESTSSDRVESWTAEQVAAAQQILEQNGATEIAVDVQPDAPGIDPATGAPMAETYSGTLTSKRKRKRVVVDNIAPEDMLISTPCRDVDQASFAGYRKEVTASDLRKLGMAQDEIDELSSDRYQSPEQWQRDPSSAMGNLRKGSERRFWLVVAYVKADDNDDGISETLRVVYAHAGGMAGNIIEKMEWTGEVPIVPGTPILMSHTIVGRSIHDQVKDIQDVKTALTRGALDNLYQVVRPRLGISNRVNLNSVIDWTPGMPIQMTSAENPAQHITAIQIPPVLNQVLPGLEYFDTVRENRTGVTRYNQGLDADSLNKTATGVNMIMSAAQQRQELIARTFAEMSIKRLARLVYRAVKRCATGPVEYYGNGDFATCDPAKWPDDITLVTNVALGTGNKQQELQNLMLIGAGQEKLIAAQGGLAGPFVTGEHVANTFRKMVEAAGFKASSQFVASPRDIAEAGQQPQQPQKSPETVKAEADAAARQMTTEAEIAAMGRKTQADIASKQAMAEVDRQIKIADAETDRQIEAANAACRLQLDQSNAQSLRDDKARAEYEAEQKAQVGRTEKAGLPAAIGQITQALVGLAEMQASMMQAISRQGSDMHAGLAALSEAMMAETEVTSSTGRTLRARKVRQQAN